MKKIIACACLLSATMIFIPGIQAQSGSAARGQSLNGSTGLYSIPTARIGWENTDFGLDLGYRAIINGDAGTAHIPALTASLFKWVELSFAFDLQPDFNYTNNKENNDLLLGIKLKLPTKKTAVAIGGNIQILNMSNDTRGYNAYQPYVAITYAGNFFNMNAETTVVFGKTFYSGGPETNSNVDFGMGFDLVLFPDVFGSMVHWLIDFSNFSYSDNAWPNSGYWHGGPAWHRGVLNTGFRVDLSSVTGNKVKFIIDAIFNDLFDAGQRSFTLGAVIGFSTR